MAIWNIYFQNGEQRNELFEINVCVADDLYDADSGYYTHIRVDTNMGNICRFVSRFIEKSGLDLEEFISDIGKIADYDNNDYAGTIGEIKNYEMNYEMALTLYEKEIIPLLSTSIASFSQKWNLSYTFRPSSMH